MTTPAEIAAEIAEDLRAHGIDPATAVYRDTRTWMGNGYISVALPGKPAREAVFWASYGVWARKISGRYDRNEAAGDIRLFPSAGAALASKEDRS